MSAQNGKEAKVHKTFSCLSPIERTTMRKISSFSIHFMGFEAGELQGAVRSKMFDLSYKNIQDCFTGKQVMGFMR